MQARTIIHEGLKAVFAEMGLQMPAKLSIEAPRQASHGDLATNAALLLAGAAGVKPLQLAASIAAGLMRKCPEIERVEVAGPGFCNIFFKPSLWINVITEIEAKKEAYGKSTLGNGQEAIVEYVSANPTGPLHVGHGRGAALGDSVARLLRAAGWSVATEYYLNDAGRQMRTLGLSILLRARELSGQTVAFPEDGYKGDYIRDLARDLMAERPDLLTLPAEEAQAVCQRYGTEEILRDIKKDLAEFRCEHQRFASEARLGEDGEVADVLEYLRVNGKSYESEGALWLRTAARGDDQDRVLRKSDGTLTYFATDIAYHRDKLKRGYQWLIDVWGADHHGYIPRMRAALAELGADPQKLSVLLVQLVNWLRDGQKVSMSTRQGEFVTLAQVIEEVGVDAARFLFLSRSCDSPLDFDLELAKKRSLDNPVYYVQYAHARVRALLRRAKEKGIELAERSSPQILACLNGAAELGLLRQLAEYEDTVSQAAKNLAPHHISRYLTDLAAQLHSYYAQRQIIDVAEAGQTQARLALLRACGQVIENGLFLLGVSAPESM